MGKAIIVGATSGIGKELATLFVKDGYHVGITGRRTNLLMDLKNENPDEYFIRTFDVKDTENIPRHLEELTAELGGLDLLVINSGTGDVNENLDFSIEKTTIETNVSGFTAVADWAFNYFQQKKSGQLAAISSITGLRGNRQVPAYHASKAYQINYLEGLRQKARKLKLPITITDIRPGYVKTALTAKLKDKFWEASVPKATQQIFTAIKQKRKVAYVTKRWAFISVILKLLPRSIYDRM